VAVGSLATILTKVNAPGARAVLVNVWATWCDPCREELPQLLRFYRDHRVRGLRLVMVSADDQDRGDEVARVLAAAARAADLDASRDLIAFIKGDDDTAFVNGLDRKWSGALPATFLYDARGKRTHSWLGPVTYKGLDGRVGPLLTMASDETRTRAKPATKPATKPAMTATSIKDSAETKASRR
jgi:thiol-disulfide isomerase/thioredoxin